MALHSALNRTTLARKIPAMFVAASLALATSGCAIFDDGRPAPRDSEAGAPDVTSQSGADNQPLWIALIAFLIAGAAAGAAASSSGD